MVTDACVWATRSAHACAWCQVGGMGVSADAIKVEAALRRVHGVAKALVSFGAGTAEVWYDGSVTGTVMVMIMMMRLDFGAASLALRST